MSGPAERSLQGWREWTTLGGLVFLLAAFRALIEGIGTTDESWFLQVVSRLRAGDVLYRDVFFGSTPLSVYVTSWPMAFIGVEIVAVKLVTSVCIALSVVAACSIASRLGAGRLLVWELAGWMLLYGRSHASPPYTPLANLFFVLCCAWALVAFDRKQAGATGVDSAFGLAAVAAGASFAAKPNFGVFACAGLAVTALACGWTEPWSKSLRRTGLILAVFVAVALALLSPIVVTGAVGPFLDYVFINKTAYVTLASRPYLAQLAAQLASEPLSAPKALGSIFYTGLWLLPPVALGAAGVALARRRLSSRAALVAVFATLAVATAYPRFDRVHLAPSALLTIPTLVAALPGALAPGTAWLGVARFVARLALAVGLLGFVVVPEAVPWLARGHVMSTLPGFRGPLVRAGEHERLSESARRLREFSGSAPTFVLGSRAGFLYVASGVTNPTPFDYPTAVSVGRFGEDRLVEAVATGRISQVCAEPLRGPEHELPRLRAAIEAHLTRGSDLGLCVAYRRADGSAERRR